MGKKIAAVIKELDQTKEYSLQEAITTIKKISFTKFDETLEVAINLGVDPRHSDQMVRGIVSLPAGLGKDVKVAVICKDEKVADAKAAGADLAGSLTIIEDIKAGKIDFDVLIATPDCMGIVGKVGRILGPKGLMPNPKTGTVTMDVTKAVNDAKGGQVTYRVDKKGNMQAGIGKVSFSAEAIRENAAAFIAAINKAKPSTAKGRYITNAAISLTMSPSVIIDNMEIMEIR